MTRADSEGTAIPSEASVKVAKSLSTTQRGEVLMCPEGPGPFLVLAGRKPETDSRAVLAHADITLSGQFRSAERRDRAASETECPTVS